MLRASPSSSLTRTMLIYYSRRLPVVLTFLYCSPQGHQASRLAGSFPSIHSHRCSRSPLLSSASYARVLLLVLCFLLKIKIWNIHSPNRYKQNMEGSKIPPNVLFLEIVIRLKNSYGVSFLLRLMQAKRLISLVIPSSSVTSHSVIWSAWCLWFGSLVGLAGSGERTLSKAQSWGKF